MADKKPKGISRLVLVMGIIIAVLAISNAYLLFPREAAPSSKPAQAPQTLQKFKAVYASAGYEGYFLVDDAGKDRGIWAKHGLDPEFSVHQKPVSVIAADIKDYVASGVKIGFNVPSEVLMARSDGVPVKIVAGYVGSNPALNLYVKGDSPIMTIKDLDAKKFGVAAKDHFTARYTLWLSQKFGIKTEIVPVGNTTSTVVALKLGRIDAFVSAGSSVLRLVDSGELRILVHFPDVQLRPTTVTVVYATDDLIDQNPDLVRRFVKATLETVRYLKENPDYAANLYIKRSNAPKDLAGKVVSYLDWTPDGRGSGQDLVLAVTNNWRFHNESGGVPAGINVKIEDAVDVRFLP